MHVLYADDLREWQRDMREVRAKFEDVDPPLSPDEWDPAVLGPRPGTDASAADEAPRMNVDPSMAAFLALERELKMKHA